MDGNNFFQKVLTPFLFLVIRRNKKNDTNNRNQNNSLNQQSKDNAKADNNIFFIILILQKDFEDIIPLVNSQSKDFQCTILKNFPLNMKGKIIFKYYII